MVPAPTPVGPPPHVLNEIATARKSVVSPMFEEIAASADEASAVYELARVLPGSGTLTEACELVTKHLRRLIPWSLCVVYKYDHGRDELVAEHAVGEGTSLVKGL